MTCLLRGGGRFGVPGGVALSSSSATVLLLRCLEEELVSNSFNNYEVTNDLTAVPHSFVVLGGELRCGMKGISV